MNKEMTSRQWLIDAARAFKSEEATEAMSRLLDALDANSIPYDINKRSSRYLQNCIKN